MFAEILAMYTALVTMLSIMIGFAAFIVIGYGLPLLVIGYPIVKLLNRFKSEKTNA